MYLNGLKVITVVPERPPSGSVKWWSLVIALAHPLLC